MPLNEQRVEPFAASSGVQNQYLGYSKDAPLQQTSQQENLNLRAPTFAPMNEFRDEPLHDSSQAPIVAGQGVPEGTNLLGQKMVERQNQPIEPLSNSNMEYPYTHKEKVGFMDKMKEKVHQIVGKEGSHADAQNYSYRQPLPADQVTRETFTSVAEGAAKSARKQGFGKSGMSKSEKLKQKLGMGHHEPHQQFREHRDSISSASSLSSSDMEGYSFREPLPASQLTRERQTAVAEGAAKSAKKRGFGKSGKSTGEKIKEKFGIKQQPSDQAVIERRGSQSSLSSSDMEGYNYREPLPADQITRERQTAVAEGAAKSAKKQGFGSNKSTGQKIKEKLGMKQHPRDQAVDTAGRRSSGSSISSSDMEGYTFRQPIPADRITKERFSLVAAGAAKSAKKQGFGKSHTTKNRLKKKLGLNKNPRDQVDSAYAARPSDRREPLTSSGTSSSSSDEQAELGRTDRANIQQPAPQNFNGATIISTTAPVVVMPPESKSNDNMMQSSVPPSQTWA